MLDRVATHWERIAGDGLVCDGPCVLKAVVMWPDADGDYADIYDGRDTTSGERFARFESAVQTTVVCNLGDGVEFGKGLYVDGKDAAVETTVAFVPLFP
jgi:hypothetical protein